MTEINTSTHARDMTESERQAFIRQCKKLEGASSQSKPVETTTRTARDMTPEQRAAWFQEHRRKFFS